jgi:hypothetical protein
MSIHIRYGDKNGNSANDYADDARPERAAHK